MDKDKKSKVDIHKKIEETVKERERLQQELQDLIALGIRGSTSAFISSTVSMPTTKNLQSGSINNVQIIKSYDAKHSEQVKDPSVSPSKKTKTYNIEQARGYIKKQKDKRLEELKNKKANKTLAAELKKEKLQELQQKANEIIRKNVERSRSKSREPTKIKSSSRIVQRSRSLSRDDGNVKTHMDPNLLYPPDPVSGTSKIESKITKENFVTIKNPLLRIETLQPLDTSLEAKLSEQKLIIDNSNRASRSRIIKPTKNQNLLCPSGFTDIQLIKDPKLNENLENNQNPPRETTAVRSIAKSLQLLPTNQKSLQSDSDSNSTDKNINIVSNITLRSANDIIPSMPEPKRINPTPEWLKEQRPTSDPFNFINTVKRHLKYTVEEKKPKFVDIGVQGDLESVKCEAKSSRTDLKSFLSHMCQKDGPTITKPPSSDSDTSKNIPSISSESGLSIKIDTNFIPLEIAPPSLDAKKVENIRLNNDTSRIRKHLFKDFNETSPINLKSSRHSIISGNCAKKSPNRVPFEISQESDEIYTNSELNKALQESEPISEVLSTNSKENLKINVESVKLSCSEKEIPFLLSNDGTPNTMGSQKYQSLFSSLHPSTDDSKSKSKSVDTSSKATGLFSKTIRTSSNQVDFTDSSFRSNITIRKHHQEVSEIPENVSFHSSNKTISSIEFSLQENLQRSAKEYSSDTMTSESEEQKNLKGGSQSKISELGLGIEKQRSFKNLKDCSKKVFSETEDSKKDLQDLYKSQSENLISDKGNSSNYRKLLSKSESNIYNFKEKGNEPKLLLNIKTNRRKLDGKGSLMKNITIRCEDESRDEFNSTHEIHLKFEAEIDLLTDFNQTIRRFSEIEKTFESLRTEKNNTEMVTKVLQNRDTQTSIASKSSLNSPSNTKCSKSTTVISGSPYNRHLAKEVQENIQNLNLTGASKMDFDLTSVNMEDTLLDNTDNSSSIMLRMTQMNCEESPRGDDYALNENAVFRSVVGMSLKMFDQMIKDEDARIENWKKVIKIREQALLDRTKGELVWLEMQKKQLIETGKLAEASMIKKKQRGIILKHQQERTEMQKLKQMQKLDSQNRKALLKRERNVIKYQMLTDNTPSKLKSFNREKSDRRLSGPFKVIQTSGATTTLHSETSAVGTDQEIKSVTTRTLSHSVVNVSEPFENKDAEFMDLAVKRRDKANVSTSDIYLMKQTLLMREQALAKRRKAVEELLQWHKKLLDEEKSIENMEKKIGTIISKIPRSNSKELTLQKSNIPSEVSSSGESLAEHTEIQKNTRSEADNYSTDFDVETAPHNSQNSNDQSSISSISLLIGDLGKIEENLLNLMNNESSKKENSKSIEEVVDDSVIFVSEIRSEENKEDKTGPLEAAADQIKAKNVTREESNKGLSSEEQKTMEEGSILEEVVSNNEVAESTEILFDNNLENQHMAEVNSEQESLNALEPLPETEPIISPPETEPIISPPETEPIISSPETEPIISSPETEPIISSNIPDNEDVSSPKQNEEIEEIPDPQPSTSQLSISSQEDDIFDESAEGAEDDHQNKTDEEKVAERGRHSSEEPSQISEINEVSFSVAVNNIEGIEECQNSATEDDNTEISQENEVASAEKSHENEKSTIEEVASLDTSNSSHSSVSTVVSSPKSPISSLKTPPPSSSGSQKSSSLTKSPIDIKKHVQDMLNVPRNDKSPRMQDLCWITYDTSSPDPSPDTGSPLDEKRPFSLGSEAEELHRKQLAIEQEIKLLKEQQQKEAASPVYVREIPNKPPPPYTPPFKSKTSKSPSVIPANKDEIEQITEYSAKIIHKAYLSNNLDNISISDNTLNLIAENIDKGSYKYVFDLCKEVAKDHYGQFAEETGPLWMRPDRKPKLASTHPLDVNGLKKLMSKTLLELFGFEKRHIKRDNAIMKWSRKKRDHVDEVLVQEMQIEESTWVNFDRDEALVKDRVTNEIMEMLLKESALALKKAMQKKIESNL